MDEFVLLAFLLFTANKSNSSVCFLGESMARQSAFRFFLTFRSSNCLKIFSNLMARMCVYICLVLACLHACGASQQNRATSNPTTQQCQERDQTVGLLLVKKYGGQYVSRQHFQYSMLTYSCFLLVLFFVCLAKFLAIP